MITLGIETSCDETALALIETREISDAKDDDRQPSAHTEYRIIQSLVHSQAELHSAYGGVFPTLAKREHSKNLVPLLEKILKDLPGRSQITNNKLQTNPNNQSINSKQETTSFKEKLESFKKEYGEQNADLLESFTHAIFLENIPDIDRIAVTEGPGLEPALWVGITFARMLGELWNIPVIPVDHMEGHVIGSLLDDTKPYGTWQPLKELSLPAVALLISGGHTELIKVEADFKYKLLGQTKDDAVGEAFDKVARLLDLPYPGGPHIAKLAHEAWEEKIQSPVKLPRPMINSGDLDFSFSGLKTAVLYAVQAEASKGASSVKDASPLSDNFKKGLAYEFEQSVAEVLDAKLRQAVESVGAQSIVIGGGVSANHVLRTRFQKTAETYSIPLFLPSFHVSGDNALMIALVGSMQPLTAKDTTHPPSTIHARGTKKITE